MSDSPDLVEMFADLAPEPGVFPDIEISTARLRLRPYSEADTEDHAAMHDHELVHLWSSDPYPYTLDHSRDWCTRIAHEIRTSGSGVMWAVTDRQTGRFLGCTGFHRTDWTNRVSDVSAIGAPWAVGHGYAKEALRVISRWALIDQQLNRLQITAAVANPAPQRVALACGFVKEGVLRHAGATAAGQVDMVMYGLVPSDLGVIGSRDEEVLCPVQKMNSPC